MTSPAKTALVLSGGGAYGAFAIGVMKALFAGVTPVTDYKPLEADIFTGTSVGAFNATLMVDQHKHGANNLEAAMHVEKIWIEQVAERPGGCGNGIFRLRGNPIEYFDPACLSQPAAAAERLAGDGLAVSSYFLARTASFFASSAPLQERALNLVNIGSFVDTNPYQELLRSVIHEPDVFQSQKSLRLVTTNWITGKAQYFENSDFQNDRGIQAVMASTAIPGVFPPVRIDDDIFVDGGVVDNTPLGPAIRMGATTIHVIYLDPQPQFIRIRAEPNTIDTMLRVYYLMLAAKLNEDLETARWINSGLAAVARFRKTGAASDSDITDFVKVAGQFLESQHAPYVPLTVHRYFPRTQMGGDFGMLDFRIDVLARMIESGERVAMRHDCKLNRCVLES